MNNFFENVLSEYYIEDNLIIVLTLMLKNEINNLKNTRDFDNFLNFNSASRFLLSELRKKNDVKNFFKDILYDTIETLESKYSETIINIEINEIQNEITQKIQNQEVNNSNIYDKLNANNKNKIFRYNESYHSKIEIGNDEFTSKYLVKLAKNDLEKKLETYKNNEYMTEYINIQLNKCKINEQIFSNKKLFEYLYNLKYSEAIFGYYGHNFLIIIEIIDKILFNLKENVNLIPYSIRCFCKIISELITKKFPNISITEKNIFISKFFFRIIFLPIFQNPSLEASINDFIISKTSIKNFSIISNIIKQLVSGNFFINKYYLPFNNYFLEKMPIIYNILEKLTNTTLSPVVEKIINDNLEEDYKYNYFDRNKNEILFHKCICYNLDIINTILKTINKNQNQIFSEAKNIEFEKTIKKLNSEISIQLIEKLTNHNDYEMIKERKNTNSKKIEYVEVKNRKKLYFFLYSDFIFNDKYKDLFLTSKNNFIYENEELNNVKTEEEALKKNVIKVKKYLSYLLVNYRKIKKTDFDNVKILNTENIIDKLKKLMNSSYYLIDNTIPSKWYADALLEYIKKIPNYYIENDYENLFLEIENDINKSIKLFNFEVLSVYDDKMKLMKRYKKFYDETKKSILDIQQNEKAKKIIENEIIPVEIHFDYKEKVFNITKSKLTKFKVSEDMVYNDNTNYVAICPTIELFQKNFPNLSKFELVGCHSFELIEKLNLPESLIDYSKHIKIHLTTILNANNSEEITNIYNIIYDYIMSKLYKKLFPTMPLKKDLQIFENCVLLSWIEPKHLMKGKTNYICELFLPDITKNIKLIETEKSPRKKMINLSKLFNSISNLQKFNGDNSALGVDGNLNILNYVIIKSKPFLLYTNAKYISLFIGEKSHQLEGNQLSQLLSICEICEKMSYKDLNDIDKDEYDKKCNEMRLDVNNKI